MRERYELVKDFISSKKISRRELLFRTGQIAVSSWTGVNASKHPLGSASVAYWTSVAISAFMKDSQVAFKTSLMSAAVAGGVNILKETQAPTKKS